LKQGVKIQIRESEPLAPGLCEQRKHPEC
jgi:hypothetical protein